MQRSPVRALGGLFNKQRAEQQEVGDRNVAKAAAAAAMASVNEELVEAKLARDCSNEGTKLPGTHCVIKKSFSLIMQLALPWQTTSGASSLQDSAC